MSLLINTSVSGTYLRSGRQVINGETPVPDTTVTMSATDSKVAYLGINADDVTAWFYVVRRADFSFVGRELEVLVFSGSQPKTITAIVDGQTMTATLTTTNAWTWVKFGGVTLSNGTHDVSITDWNGVFLNKTASGNAGYRCTGANAAFLNHRTYSVIGAMSDATFKSTNCVFEVGWNTYDSGSRTMRANRAQSGFWFSFTGTRFSLGIQRANASGNSSIAIVVDGELLEVITLSGSALTYVTTSAFAPGPHEVRVFMNEQGIFAAWPYLFSIALPTGATFNSAPAVAGKTVIAGYGDSKTEATLTPTLPSAAQGWVFKFADAIGAVPVNGGLTAQNLHTWGRDNTTRITSVSPLDQPSEALVWLGVNDNANSISQANFEASGEAMLDTLVAALPANTPITLIQPNTPGTSSYQTYTTNYETAAGYAQSSVYALTGLGASGTSPDWLDSLHESATGNTKIAKQLVALRRPLAVTSRTVASSGLTLDVVFNIKITTAKDVVSGTTGHTINVNGSPRSATVSLVPGSQTAIRFTFATPVLATDTVTHSYSPGTTTDRLGNALGSFANQSVTNNSSQ